MKRMILTIVVLFAFAMPATASTGWWWRPAASHPGWFVRDNGYRNDGWFYTRTRVCGNCCRWVYCRTPYRTTYYRTTYRTTSGIEGWRTRLLDIYATRDRYAHQIAASAIEHNEFLETAEALGIEPIAAYSPRYATGGGYGIGATAAYQQLGNTAYGYGQGAAGSYAPQISQIDINSALQKFGRIIEQGQQGVSQHATELSTILNTVGSTTTQVAKIEALSRMVQAATKDNGDKQSIVLQKKQDGKAGMQVLGDSTDLFSTAKTATAEIIKQLCVNCHDAKHSKRGDLSDFESWTPTERKKRRLKIIAAITNADPAKRMPLAKDGSPGAPLTPQMIEAIVMALSQ